MSTYSAFVAALPVTTPCFQNDQTCTNSKFIPPNRHTPAISVRPLSTTSTLVHASALPPGITRQSLPLFVDDLVTVTDPDLIRRIAESPDVGRPGHPKAEIPFLFQTFFKATKTYTPSPPNPEWAIPMLPDPPSSSQKDSVNHDFAYLDRIAEIRQSLERGFTAEQLAMFDSLASEPPTNDRVREERELGAFGAKMIAPLVLPLKEGQVLPDDVAYASIDTLIDFESMFNPLKYIRARKARKLAEGYVQTIMPDADQRTIDYVHHLGAAAEGIGKALARLRRMPNGTTPRAKMAADPIIPDVVRLPTTTTTLDGIVSMDKPLVPGKSVIVLNIGESLKQTEDTLFMFGAGVQDRQCPFKKLLLSTIDGFADRT